MVKQLFACPQREQGTPRFYVILLGGGTQPPAVAENDDMPGRASNGGIQPIPVYEEVGLVAEDDNTWEFAALPFVRS